MLNISLALVLTVREYGIKQWVLILYRLVSMRRAKSTGYTIRDSLLLAISTLFNTQR